MADAKIINYGQPIGGGTTVIPDNNSTALDVESVDGDYLTIDTSNSSEKILIASGAPTTFKAGFGTASPDKRFHFHAETGGGSEDIMRITSKTEASKFVLWQCEGQSNRGVMRIFNGGSPCHIFDSEGLAYGGVIINEQGFSTCDFRVESDSNTHQFFLDSSENKIGLNESTPSKMLDLMNGASGGDILCFDIFTHDGAVETSDERMKENIVETPLGLDFIKSLNPVAYKWKDTPETRQAYTVPGTPDTPEHVAEQVYPAVTYTRTHHGLLAQEVNAAIESAGLTAKDFAGYCYEEERDEHRLRYSQFIAPLIKSVKELSSQVEALTARVTELESGG